MKPLHFTIGGSKVDRKQKDLNRLYDKGTAELYEYLVAAAQVVAEYPKKDRVSTKPPTKTEFGEDIH